MRQTTPVRPLLHSSKRQAGALTAIGAAIWLLLSPAAGLGQGAASSQADRWLRLGVALGDHSDREMNYYLRALQEKPGYAPALFHLGALYQARGGDDMALKCFLGALSSDPTYSVAHLRLADFLWHADVDPGPAESEPRLEIKPSIRRLELARYHLQRFVDSEGDSEKGFVTEGRVMLAEVEGLMAKEKSASPLPFIGWEEAARRLQRPADPTRSPYQGPRIPLAVEFDTGSAIISYGSTYLLDSIARALDTVELKGAKVMVEGHADSTGNSEANMKLSKQRAQSVRDYLVSRGLARERFLVAGYGALRPIVRNDTPDTRQLNRRIEIVNWDEVLKARGRPENKALAVSPEPQAERRPSMSMEQIVIEAPVEEAPVARADEPAVETPRGAAADRTLHNPAVDPARRGATPTPDSAAPDPRSWDIYLHRPRN